MYALLFFQFKLNIQVEKHHDLGHKCHHCSTAPSNSSSGGYFFCRMRANRRQFSGCVEQFSGCLNLDVTSLRTTKAHNTDALQCLRQANPKKWHMLLFHYMVLAWLHSVSISESTWYRLLFLTPPLTADHWLVTKERGPSQGQLSPQESSVSFTGNSDMTITFLCLFNMSTKNAALPWNCPELCVGNQHDRLLLFVQIWHPNWILLFTQ